MVYAACGGAHIGFRPLTTSGAGPTAHARTTRGERDGRAVRRGLGEGGHQNNHIDDLLGQESWHQSKGIYDHLAFNTMVFATTW